MLVSAEWQPGARAKVRLQAALARAIDLARRRAVRQSGARGARRGFQRDSHGAGRLQTRTLGRRCALSRRNAGGVRTLYATRLAGFATDAASGSNDLHV